MSQNLIKNPSFEEREYDTENKVSISPKDISDDLCPDLYDEVTRCLGMYIYSNTMLQTPCYYPPYDKRRLNIADGGCDGWYNPLPESLSTPDYFRRDGLSQNIQVPNNLYNNNGRASYKQEPFDDNMNSIIDQGTEDAYVGFWNIRMWNNFHDNVSNYSEYITQRIGDLTQPYNSNIGTGHNVYLKAGHYYHVKFRVSWTTDIDGSQILNYKEKAQQTKHYLKGIGAYFSAVDPFHSPRWGYTVLDIDDHDPNLVLDQNYFTNPTYYNQTGGTNGLNWMTVENYFHPNTNLNFITIGNFQGDWSLDNRLGYDAQTPTPTDSQRIQIYYFLDAVEVEETDCTCGLGSANDNYYKITYEPKLRQPGDVQCCEKVYIELNGEYKPYICQANKVEIWQKIGNSYNKIYTFDDNGGYFHLRQNKFLINDNLCFPEGGTYTLKYKFFDGNNLVCTYDDTHTSFCACGCETQPEYKFNIAVTNYRQNFEGRCCWDITLENNSDCFFSVNSINMDIDPADINILTTTLTPNSDWLNGYPISLPNGKTRYQFLNDNTNKTIAPTNGTPIILGTICMDAGSPSSLPKHIEFSYNTANGPCSRLWSADLLCPDCCSHAHITVNPVPAVDDGNSCCYNLNIVTDPQYTCQAIKRIDIRNSSKNSSIFHSLEYTPPATIPGTIQFCVNHGEFGLNTSLTIHITVIGQDGQPICENDVSIDACSNWPSPCVDPCTVGEWTVGSATLPGFDCGDEPNVTTCSGVTFDYWYRKCEDGNGNIIHRDIQITNYSFPQNCQCEEDKIQEMIKYVWLDADVMARFSIKDPGCVNDMRVLTSDCWSLPAIDANGNVETHKCNTSACCFAVYKVCYKLDLPSGKLIFDPDQPPTKLSASVDALIPCSSGCIGNNCTKWKPDILDILTHPHARQPYIELPINDIGCNVKLQNDHKSGEITLNIECSQKGKLNIELFDIQGNIVYQNQLIKSDYTVTSIIKSDLLSGFYFVRLKLDGNMIFNDKILFVK